MMRRSTLRASDDDRERAADRLRQAAGEGRILAHELEDRLESAFSARTYGELSALLADLPAPRARSRRALPVWARAALIVAAVLGALAALAIAVLLIAAIAAAWVTWVLLSRGALGRGRCVPGGRHARIVAGAVHHARAGAGVTRRGRAAL